MENMFLPMLVIQIIAIAGFLLLLRFFYYRNLKNALTRLDNLHEENVVKEEKLKEELERGRAERAAEVQKGKAEAKLLLEEAKKEADNLKIRLEDEAKKQADEIILRAREEAGSFKQRLLGEVGNQALDLSLQMIKYTFSTQGKETLQHHFIDEVISEISALSNDKFTVSTDTIKVTTAFSLNESERQNLRKTISEKLNSEVSIEERVDPDLVTGLILEIGALVIDGSLKNRLTRALDYLKSDKSWY